MPNPPTPKEGAALVFVSSLLGFGGPPNPKDGVAVEAAVEAAVEGATGAGAAEVVVEPNENPEVLEAVVAEAPKDGVVEPKERLGVFAGFAGSLGFAAPKPNDKPAGAAPPAAGAVLPPVRLNPLAGVVDDSVAVGAGAPKERAGVVPAAGAVEPVAAPKVGAALPNEKDVPVLCPPDVPGALAGAPKEKDVLEAPPKLNPDSKWKSEKKTHRLK